MKQSVDPGKLHPFPEPDRIQLLQTVGRNLALAGILLLLGVAMGGVPRVAALILGKP